MAWLETNHRILSGGCPLARQNHQQLLLDVATHSPGKQEALGASAFWGKSSSLALEACLRLATHSHLEGKGRVLTSIDIYLGYGFVFFAINTSVENGHMVCCIHTVASCIIFVSENTFITQEKGTSERRRVSFLKFIAVIRTVFSPQTEMPF